jgi:hypothetical protein
VKTVGLVVECFFKEARVALAFESKGLLRRFVGSMPPVPAIASEFLGRLNRFERAP